MKKVIVPQADLDKLEKARKKLFELIDMNDIDSYMKFSCVTGIMWGLGNTKYPKYHEDDKPDPFNKKEGDTSGNLREIESLKDLSNIAKLSGERLKKIFEEE